MDEDPRNEASAAGSPGRRRGSSLAVRIALVAIVLLALAWVVWRQAH